jgi:hypothetical protein
VATSSGDSASGAGLNRPAAPVVSRPPDGSAPLLIKHGWDMPSPVFVRDHVAAMERMPFDGLTIALPGLGSKVQRSAPVSYEQFRDALSPLAATKFTTLNHNFATVYATPAGSYFDDYSVPVANFANLARAAREAGLAGILYDNEEYFGSVSNYPGACPDHTLAECQAQARLRGRQVMDAMRAVWPDVRVMSFYGPWVSEAKTFGALRGLVGYNDVSAENELMGPFFVGMAQSASGTPAQLIDGGEIYTARTESEFAAVKQWQTVGMPAESDLIPEALKPSWAATVRNGFGIYDQPWLNVDMNVDIWQSTITNALKSTDHYVWLYTERYDWWGSGWPATPVPTAWVAATRTARSAAIG